jgi:HPt (histidine-containing phosphotransfer) domain-containing protein
MAGIIARSSAIARSRKEAPMVDNYVTYLQRIEEAQESLRQKLDRNKNRISFLSVHEDSEENSRNEWQSRVRTVEAALQNYDGDAEGYEALAGLLHTAQSMLAMYTARCASHRETIGHLRAQELPLITHINQLSASKGKLHSARSLEQAKGSMDQILASRNTPGYAVPAAKEEQELRAIKQLIAESEALAELKG